MPRLSPGRRSIRNCSKSIWEAALRLRRIRRNRQTIRSSSSKGIVCRQSRKNPSKITQISRQMNARKVTMMGIIMSFGLMIQFQALISTFLLNVQDNQRGKLKLRT